MPTIRSGRSAPSCSLVIGMAEVLLAIKQRSGATISISRKAYFLKAGLSVIASITAAQFSRQW